MHSACSSKIEEKVRKVRVQRCQQTAQRAERSSSGRNSHRRIRNLENGNPYQCMHAPGDKSSWCGNNGTHVGRGSHVKGSLDSLLRGRLENVEPGFDKRSGIWQKEILKGKSERVEPKLRRSASVVRISKEGKILQSGVCVSGSSHLDVVVGSSR